MLEELYQELILDHNHHPHNFGRIENATHLAQGHNPLCGDEIQVFLKIKNNTIEEIKFEGQGCAISKASASLMTDELMGKSLDEAKKLFEDFHRLLTKEEARGLYLNKAQILAGVKQYPMRVKCATLAWHTFDAALSNRKESVKTE